MKKQNNYFRLGAACTMLGLFLLGQAPAAQAQQENSETRKVRVKMFQNINGVETMRDTVMEISGDMKIPDLTELSKFRTDFTIPEGAQRKMIVVKPDGKLPEGIRFENSSPEDLRKLLGENGDMKQFRISVGDGKLLTDSLLKQNIVIMHREGKFDQDKLPVQLSEKHLFRLQELEHPDPVKLKALENIRIMHPKGDTLVVIKKLVLVVQDISKEEKQLLDETAKREINSNKLKDLELEELNIYPNPTTGFFKLSFDATRKSNTTISILDALGREVYRENLSNFKGRYDKELDLSRQAKGMYYLQIIQGKQVLNKKILLQ